MHISTVVEVLPPTDEAALAVAALGGGVCGLAVHADHALILTAHILGLLETLDCQVDGSLIQHWELLFGQLWHTILEDQVLEALHVGDDQCGAAACLPQVKNELHAQRGLHRHIGTLVI
jgi:hypothetical protein